jgi:hypothetical protein
MLVSGVIVEIAVFDFLTTEKDGIGVNRSGSTDDYVVGMAEIAIVAGAPGLC